MPHFDQYTATTPRILSDTDTDTDSNTPIPVATNLVQHATPRCCKTGSIPLMAMDAQKTSNTNFGHTHNATHSPSRGADTSVNSDVLTSRSASPSSSFSRSDTLVDLSDAGSTTTVEVANPSVAERRLKFKEEFELPDNVEELNNAKSKDKPMIAPIDDSSSPPTTKPPKSATSVKNAKTKDRKRSRRSSAQRFRLGSRNVYTGGNATDKIGSAILDGGVGRKAMLGGPSIASGMIGCNVM